TPLIEMAVPDLVTMLPPSFHICVGHLLHERGKIAIPLGPNDEMPVVGHQTVSPQPHPASSQRFLNDPLERQKVLVLGEKHSPARASVEHVENHPPPGECRLGRDIHGFLPRYPSFVNLVAVTFSVPNAPRWLSTPQDHAVRVVQRGPAGKRRLVLLEADLVALSVNYPERDAAASVTPQDPAVRVVQRGPAGKRRLVLFEADLVALSVNYPERDAATSVTPQDPAVRVVQRGPAGERPVLLEADPVALSVNYPERDLLAPN